MFRRQYRRAESGGSEANHHMFVTTLAAGAGSYEATEAANATAAG
ncbi:PE domain-containing protein [Mycobacterium riyadhense]